MPWISQWVLPPALLLAPGVPHHSARGLIQLTGHKYDTPGINKYPNLQHALVQRSRVLYKLLQ